ncbi:MAG TPA: AraC family transcriptional regulator [Chitinophaga sp.]|uniref:AraC family transcriptional regulator n=1 Tax=Chitinophaga sp. TaxID=1869181 RepID=UPI002BAD103E|nr:AraC family transcriptional regulator [Chitinophaga sp.]HVI43511.1 AraC family transcriptional regulator [Chitinophaga sp.]
MPAILKPGEYYGNRKKSACIDGISLFHQQYSPLSSSPVHSHQHTHFCYTIEGAFHDVTRNSNLLVTAGQLLIYPHNREHKTQMQRYTRSCLFIEFDEQWMERLDAMHIHFDRFNCISNSGIAHLFMRMFGELCNPAPASDLLLEGLVLESIAIISRENNTGEKMLPGQVKKICNLLQENYAEKWTLNEIAARSGFHPVYLNRLFKQHTGKTIHHYLEDIRTEKACERLKHTDDPVAEIAYDCGFTDTSHLHKTLLKKKGHRPLAYRNMMQQ